MTPGTSLKLQKRKRDSNSIDEIVSSDSFEVKKKKRKRADSTAEVDYTSMSLSKVHVNERLAGSFITSTPNNSEIKIKQKLKRIDRKSVV